MKKISELPKPSTLEPEEYLKTRNDPEYLVAEYLAEPGDVVTSEVLEDTNIMVTVVEAGSPEIIKKIKFIKKI